MVHGTSRAGAGAQRATNKGPNFLTQYIRAVRVGTLVHALVYAALLEQSGATIEPRKPRKPRKPTSADTVRSNRALYIDLTA